MAAQLQPDKQEADRWEMFKNNGVQEGMCSCSSKEESKQKNHTWIFTGK